MDMKLSRALYAGTALAAVMTVNAPASWAQERQQQVDVITVTAQRVETDLQTTPIAVSAFTGEALSSAGISDSVDIQRLTPNLQIGGDAQLGSFPIVLRGVGAVDPEGPSQDSPIAVYSDGVFLSRSFQQAFLLSDVERVEVLRGPQGTLFGRNSSGGAMNFVTLQPESDLEALASVEYGSYDSVIARGYVLAPINENWGFKLSAAASESDGFATNVGKDIDVPEQEAVSVRGSIRFHDSDWDVVLQAETGSFDHRSHFNNPTFNPGVDRDTNTANRPHFEERSFDLVSLNVDRELEFGTLTAILGYAESEVDGSFDSDSSALDLVRLGPTLLANEQFSAEVRLASHQDQRFRWIGGVFYFDETGVFEGDVRAGSLFTGLPDELTIQRFDNEADINSIAAFGEVYYDITERLTATAGLRYTAEEKSYLARDLLLPDPVKIDQEEDWDAVTPRFVLDYQASENTMIYVSASRGFRSGTWTITADDPIPADPEYVWSYEAGLKADLFDNRARFNIAAFHMDFSDKQERVNTGIGVTGARNATSADIDGVEMEFDTIPFENARVQGSVGYLDARYSDFVGSPADVAPNESFIFTGNRLPRAPEWQTSLIGSYTIPTAQIGDITLRAEWYYESETFYTRENDPDEGHDGHHNVAARAIWEPTPAWQFMVFGENLTDDRYVSAVQNFDQIGLGTPKAYNFPTTWGARLTWRH